MRNNVITMPPIATAVAKGPLDMALAELMSREGKIAILREKYAGMTAESGLCNTRDGYEQFRVARAELRTLRTGVEKSRKALKADALEYGRQVDSAAKRITEVIEDIEKPIVFAMEIHDEKKRVDRERQDRAERDRIAAEVQARLDAEQAVLRVEREAEEARLKVVRDAENERLRVENERLKAERDELDRERKIIEDAQRIEREKLAQERLAIERQRQQTERAEFERAAVIRAEAEATARVERDRVEAAARVERDRVHADRVEKLRPDVEKVRSFAGLIRELTLPVVESEIAKAELAKARKFLIQIATNLERWKLPDS